MTLIAAMCVFALMMSISPGPVNLITLSSGVNHGVQKTLPFVSGATVGFTLLLMVLGLGLVQLLNAASPSLHYLGYFGAMFIIYMGYKIATAKVDIVIKEVAIPRFYEGVLLQWLNPKAWIAAVSGISAFSVEDSYQVLFLFSGLYFVICFFSVASWAFVGERLAMRIRSEVQMKLFNRIMGASLGIIGCYLLLAQ
ncbi:LysE family translocator [Sedimenticola sp.]|uniref:LysE family translocator n=1 Tax=Sedimenticola sp. TaxID=1940285 RepID=UPI003D1500EE